MRAGWEPAPQVEELMHAIRGFLFFTMWLCLVASGEAQGPDFSKLIEAMEKDGCAVHEPSKVKLCKRDYNVDGKNVEAISFQPSGAGPFPALLLIPGHLGTARDWIPNGLTFAGEGYAGLA